MKKSIKFLGLGIIFLSLLFTVSCKKEKPASMTCKIDGTQFTTLVRKTTKGGISDWNKEGFVIVGTDGISLSDGKYLTILIAGQSEKEYGLNINIFDAKAGCTVVYNAGGQDGDDATKYTGTGGKVNVTEIIDDGDEKLISGTFSFELVNVEDATKTMSITEGTFEYLKYTEASISAAMIKMFAGAVI